MFPLKTLALLTWLLVFSLPVPAESAPNLKKCQEAMTAAKIEKKRIDRYFKLSAIKDENDSVVVLKWMEGPKLSEKQHRDLYLNTVAAFDNLLLKGKCEEEFKRMIVLYPPISYSIAVSELKAIRIYKRESPMWKSQVIVRSTVVHIK